MCYDKAPIADVKPIEHVDATLHEQLAVFDIIPCGISNTPQVFLNSRPIVHNELGQFDEVIP